MNCTTPSHPGRKRRRARPGAPTRYFLALCFLGVFAPTLASEGGLSAGEPALNEVLNRALSALDAERYDEAHGLLERAAKAGHLPATAVLGDVHYFGWGVDVDYLRAARLYRQAADRDHPGGYFGLGRQYLFGHGVDKDVGEAMHWFTLAGRAGPVDLETELNDVMCLPRDDLAKAEKQLRTFVKYTPLRPGTYLHTQALRAAFSCQW
mgnify:CR=1 FL=1